jgi:prepilin signal peptidase PulO-like enzyme (type II secretory pathway)
MVQNGQFKAVTYFVLGQYSLWVILIVLHRPSSVATLLLVLLGSIIIIIITITIMTKLLPIKNRIDCL